MKLRFENLASQDIYNIFFNAIRNKKGAIRTLRIDGKKCSIFILNRNPFDNKYVLALESLSIHRVKTFFGQIVSIEKVLDMNDASENNQDRFKEELNKLSTKISENMKSKFLERLKLKQIKPVHPKPKPRAIPKFKPKRPM